MTPEQLPHIAPDSHVVFRDSSTLHMGIIVGGSFSITTAETGVGWMYSVASANRTKIFAVPEAAIMAVYETGIWTPRIDHSRDEIYNLATSS